MELTDATIAVAAAAFVAALVTGAIGYGFSSITVPVALLFIPSKTLAPALVLLELATNMFGLFTHRKDVPAIARRMLPVLLGVAPGVGLGAWVLSTASGGPLKLATYAVMLPLVIAQTAGRRWPIRNEKAAALPAGVAIGALYGATTISGPPIALFLNNQGLAPTEFRAAVYLVRVGESLVTTVIYAALGLFVRPSLVLSGQLLPSLLLGIPLGMVLLRRIAPEPFRRIAMAACAAFIAFGLARVTIELHLLPAPIAYGGLLAVIVIEAWILARYFALRPSIPHR